MKHACRFAQIGASALIALAACGPREATPPDTPSRSASLTANDLANATYEGIYDSPVRLTDGRFTGEPFEPGAASRPTLTFLWNTAVFGDLDGDGAEEGIGLLVENSGGSGSFVYLAVVGAVEGELRSLSTVLVGDRAKVANLEIDGSTIRATVIAPGPDGPMSVPEQTMLRQWELQDGSLIETTAHKSPEPER